MAKGYQHYVNVKMYTNFVIFKHTFKKKLLHDKHYYEKNNRPISKKNYFIVKIYFILNRPIYKQEVLIIKTIFVHFPSIPTNY